MSDFKAKMHQIRFWLWLHLRPTGELTAITAVVGGEGTRCPLPKDPTPAIGPSGLELRPCGPRTTCIDQVIPLTNNFWIRHWLRV